MTPPPPDRRQGRAGGAGLLAYLVLIFFSLIYLYPFLIQIATSFKTNADATANPLNPDPPGMDGWTPTGRCARTISRCWFMNSVIVTLFVTVGRVFFDSLAGYALARLHFRGRRSLMAALFIGSWRCRRSSC